ncbi:MAG TPA: AbrB/MazE/SpoVT family DNA-binding domain-containing protein [Noviherbaspirillum sp.]|nr:AbrB/MazE/SpoVT family DNA-binding domain-containing protein [Noviherbaspirillum sp.]
MYTLKLIRTGNSVDILLPREMVDILEHSPEDLACLTETADGWRLSLNDPTLQDQLEAGREFMRDFRATLDTLAV